MKIQLPWGDQSLSIDIPDSWDVIFPERRPAARKGLIDEKGVIQRSLSHPIGTDPPVKMKLRGKKILIVTDDNTRPTPAEKILSELLALLTDAGASKKNITLMSAGGIHTPMTEDEIAEKVGRRNLDGIKWANHDAFDGEAHHFFGTTSRGTPVFLNRSINEADLVITLGLIEPHLWAGFGGGLKNLLPGLASAETIGIHHRIIAEPPYLFNRVGVLPEENSFRLDLEEIQTMIKAPIFCVNVVLNPKKEIIASFAGCPIEAHRAGVDFNIRELGLRMDRQVDGIIVNSYPMEINFKQGMKCVGNSLPALKPGGAVMGFLKAERGIDDIVLPEKATPLWLAKRILRLIGPSRVYGFMERVKKGFNVEEKFLTYYGMQLVREHDLFLYVPALSQEEARLLGIYLPCSTPEEVIRRGVKRIGRKATVAVFPEGGATFPIVG